MKKRLDEKNVEIRADEGARSIVPEFTAATEEDWGKEYLDLIISVKTVSDIDEAIRHINTYNTGALRRDCDHVLRSRETVSGRD